MYIVVIIPVEQGEKVDPAVEAPDLKVPVEGDLHTVEPVPVLVTGEPEDIPAFGFGAGHADRANGACLPKGLEQADYRRVLQILRGAGVQEELVDVVCLQLG